MKQTEEVIEHVSFSLLDIIFRSFRVLPHELGDGKC